MNPLTQPLVATSAYRYHKFNNISIDILVANDRAIASLPKLKPQRAFNFNRVDHNDSYYSYYYYCRYTLCTDSNGSNRS